MDSLNDGQAMELNNSRHVSFPSLETSNGVAPFAEPMNYQQTHASLFQGPHLHPSQFVHPQYGINLAAAGNLSLPSCTQSSFLSSIHCYPNLQFCSAEPTPLSSLKTGIQTAQASPLMVITVSQGEKESNMAARQQAQIPSFSSMRNFAVSSTPTFPMTGVWHNQRVHYPSHYDYIRANATPVSLMQPFNTVPNLLLLSKNVSCTSQRMNQICPDYVRLSCRVASERLAQISSTALLDSDSLSCTLPEVDKKTLTTITPVPQTDLPSTLASACRYRSQDIVPPSSQTYSNYRSTDVVGEICCGYTSKPTTASGSIHEMSVIGSKGFQNKSEDQKSRVLSSCALSGSTSVPYQNQQSFLHDDTAYSVTSAEADSRRQDQVLGTMVLRTCSSNPFCPASDDVPTLAETRQSLEAELGDNQHFLLCSSLTDVRNDSNRRPSNIALNQKRISPVLNAALKETVQFCAIGRTECKSAEGKQSGKKQGENVKSHDTATVQPSSEDSSGYVNALTDSIDCDDCSVRSTLVEDVVVDASCEKTMDSTTQPLMTSANEATISSLPEFSAEKARKESGIFLEELSCPGKNVDKPMVEKDHANLADIQVVGSQRSESIPQEGQSAAERHVKKSVKTVKDHAKVVIDSSQCFVEGSSRRWQCSLCEKSYTTRSNLVIHILDHQGVKPHKCPKCGQSFRQLGHLNTHTLTHDKIKPHKCETCGKSFTQASHLKRHQVVHRSTSYVCDRCERMFTYPSDLQAHKKRCEKKSRVPLCSRSIPPAPTLLDKPRSESCKQCDKVFKSASQLMHHMLSHSSERLYKCAECGLNFWKERNLRAHQLTHSTVKPFQCKVCGRGFHQKANMSRHQLIHNSIRAFECQVCGKKFTQLQILKAHRVTHSEKKPFQCQLCGRGFSRLYNFQSHMHIHDNSKPYVCFCGKSFTLRGNLTRHKKVKHGLDETTEYMDETTEYLEEEAVKLLKSFSERARDERNPVSNSFSGLTNVSKDDAKKAETHLNKEHSEICDKAVSKIGSVSMLQAGQISKGSLNSRCFTKGVLGLHEISPR